jgi:hypothetical protein
MKTAISRGLNAYAAERSPFLAGNGFCITSGRSHDPHRVRFFDGISEPKPLENQGTKIWPSRRAACRSWRVEC